MLHSFDLGTFRSLEACWMELTGSNDAAMNVQDMENYDELMDGLLDMLPAEQVLAQHAPSGGSRALTAGGSGRTVTDRVTHKGSCLCGAVSFEVQGELPPPDACHCSQCRKQSGHFFASTDVPRDVLTINGGDKVTWFRSSEKVRRGFCSVCGSALFWDPIHEDWIGLAMGAFDLPTHTRLRIHIHVASKGDYYDIADGLPQNEH